MLADKNDMSAQHPWLRLTILRQPRRSRPTRARPQHKIAIKVPTRNGRGEPQQEVDYLSWDIPRNELEWYQQCRAIVQAVNAGNVLHVTRTHEDGREQAVDPDHLRARCLQQLAYMSTQHTLTGRRGQKRTNDDYSVRKRRRA